MALTEEKQSSELALSQMDKEDLFLDFFPSLFEPALA